MSVQIRSFANPITPLNPNQAPLADESIGAPPGDFFNIIAIANTVYDLYKAPKVPTDGSNKAALVKGIRLINTHPTIDVKVTLYFNRPNADGYFRRRLLAPAGILLPPGYSYVDEGEIALEPGDKLQASADTANAIHFVISGVERDVN